MRYCSDCGTGHECENETGREKAEVAIARLNTNRDIEVARINATAGVHIAETEVEGAAEHAEGVVEGVGAVLDAVTGGAVDEGEPVPAGEPIVVEAPAEDETEAPLDVPEPPVVVPDTGGSAKPAGWWSGYR